ncbi:MAG: hypothetical protein ACYTFW_18840 [Planctomycetota bacterium]|jgi:hypothetical protein
MTKKYYSYEQTHHTFKGVKQKRCTKCMKWKDESEFRKDSARKDGLRNRCKDCDRAHDRKRYRKNGKAVRKLLVLLLQTVEVRERVLQKLQGERWIRVAVQGM